MESGHKSGGGASGGGGGGGLCNACGYQYPNPHPSAKQRRAHRKNCGKPPSAAAVEGSGEPDGEKLPLGEREGGGGGGEGNGARAADCGGGLPGSAREAGDVAENEDNAGHSSHGTGVQDIINKFSEDRVLISCDDAPSEIARKAIGIDNDEIQIEVAENAPHLEDGHPSQPAVSSDQRRDSSTSVIPPEPEDTARFSSDLSVDEINNSNFKPLASNATAGEVSAQTNAIVVCPDDIAVTEVEGKDKTSGDILVKRSEIDSSCQEKPQTKIDEGHSDTTVEEDPSVNNFNVVSREEIPDEETESKEQIRLILTNSKEQVSTIKEPVNLLGNKESCTEKHVCAEDTNGGDLFELATGGCHLEAPDSVKTQQQTDSISVAADELTIPKQTIPKQTDIEEGQHRPDADGVIIQAVSSAIGPAVGAEVISACSAPSLTKNVCSSEVRAGDGILENVSHTSGITFMPSQVDLAEFDTYPTSHEIEMVSSKDGVEENRQNENISAELTSHEINEVRSIDVEEKQQIEDITAYTTSHEANAVCSTASFGENEPNEEIIAESSSHEIIIVQSTGSVEEKEQVEEVIANPASNKIDVISGRVFVEEKKQSEVYVETTHDINVACSIENAEGEKQNEEITADPTCEINAVNIASNVELKKHNEESTRDPTACEINMANIVDNVEEKKQNEEITTDSTHAINVICSPDSEDNKPNEDMTEGPSSHEIIVVHGTDNVKEKNGETMSDPTSYQIVAVSTADGVDEKKQNEEITAVPTSRGIYVVHTIDNVEEKKNEEPTSDPTSCKIDAENNTDGIEEKRQDEEIAAGSSSHENNILRGTVNAEEKKQNEEAAADPVSDKITAAQGTDDAEERKQKEETAAKEINTTQSTDDLKGNDQNEAIADKEVIADSDKNHVSLKVLLAEKGVETKEKKASTKDRVLSFRRRASKDNASPVKPGSPKAGSGHQDWNSPARLPIEKKSKGKKQQWLPFICCPSIN